MWKFLLVTIITVFLFAALFLMYSKLIQEDNIISMENKTLSQFHDYSKKSEYVSENDFNIKVLYFEEKYNSLNKRFDDLYILGSMIVLLLITINIGIFVNTDSKVEKYFTKNFRSHLLKIEEIAAKSAIEFGKLEAFSKQAEAMKQTTEDPTR